MSKVGWYYMSKKTIFLMVLLVFFATFLLLWFMFGKEKKMNNIIADNFIIIENEKIPDNEKVIETSVGNEKITPNTILEFKKEYTDCGHTIISMVPVSDEIVNLDATEIAEKYPNWDIEEFSQERVTLSSKVDSFCGEHYLIKEDDGIIKVYSIDESGNLSLKEDTKISIKYLTETDKISLREGIMIYGTENLKKLMEDYET